MPKVFESLWAACGRDFHADVDLRPLEPFYDIPWPAGSYFRASGDDEKMQSEVQRLNPADLSGYKRLLNDLEDLWTNNKASDWILRCFVIS